MLSVVIVICVLPAPFGEDRWRVLCLWIVYRSRSTGCIQWHKPVSSAGSQSGCWVITCYCGHAFLAWQHSPSAEEGSWNSCALVKLRMVPAVFRQLCLSSDRFKCWFHGQRTRLYPCLLCADGASSLETALTVLRQVHVLISWSAYQTLPLLVVCGWCQQSWDSFVRPQTGSRADFTVGVPDFTPACCVPLFSAVRDPLGVRAVETCFSFVLNFGKVCNFVLVLKPCLLDCQYSFIRFDAHSDAWQPRQ